MDDLSCPTCSAINLARDDVCDHRPRLCVTCCLGGEHHWYTPPPWEAA